MSERRTIKRYTNRKLYDKLESRYVTLEEIARLVRAGEDIHVIDNETEEDLTSVTFAQIILEEEKRKQNLLSVPFLRRLIRTGEARVQDISDRASRSIEAIGDLTGKAQDRVREVVGGSGRAIEESLSPLFDELFMSPQKRLANLGDAAREQIDKIRGNPTVQRELERIAGSLHTLEEAVARLADDQDDDKAEEPASANDTASQAGPETASKSESADGFSTSTESVTPKSGMVNGASSEPHSQDAAEAQTQVSADKPDQDL